MLFFLFFFFGTCSLILFLCRFCSFSFCCPWSALALAYYQLVNQPWSICTTLTWKKGAIYKSSLIDRFIEICNVHVASRQIKAKPNAVIYPPHTFCTFIAKHSTNPAAFGSRRNIKADFCECVWDFCGHVFNSRGAAACLGLASIVRETSDTWQVLPCICSISGRCGRERRHWYTTCSYCKHRKWKVTQLCSAVFLQS